MNDSKKTNRTKWNFYKDDAGEWRWQALDANGHILFISAEGYVNKSDAEQCAKRAGWGVRKDAENTTHSVVTTKKKKSIFEIIKSWFKGCKPKEKPPSYGNQGGFH